MLISQIDLLVRKDAFSTPCDPVATFLKTKFSDLYPLTPNFLNHTPLRKTTDVTDRRIDCLASCITRHTCRRAQSRGLCTCGTRAQQTRCTANRLFRLLTVRATYVCVGAAPEGAAPQKEGYRVIKSIVLLSGVEIVE